VVGRVVLNHRPLDSNKKLRKSKCFIQCRLGTRKPFFLSLYRICTELHPRAYSAELFPTFSFEVICRKSEMLSLVRTSAITALPLYLELIARCTAKN
jgi:hypothetical protein